MVDIADRQVKHQLGIDFLECSGCGALTFFPWDGFGPSRHDGPYPVLNAMHSGKCGYRLRLDGLVFAQRAQFEGVDP